MPIFKAGSKLVYYAHVPKCAGSALENFLEARFGNIAFLDQHYTGLAPEARWSKTSPQHIDAASIARLFPDGFFDASMTVVRHPVSRLVSVYHFQQEVERLIPDSIGFSEWLEGLAEDWAENPFIFDNHPRPMVDLVPEGAEVFHLEHGLDAIILWFDALTGDSTGPRAIPKVNERGAYAAKTGKASVTDADRALIAKLYAADFERFGYQPDQKAPNAPAPLLPADFIKVRDAELKRHANPIRTIARKVQKRLIS